jgi:hypothetical protein
MSTSPRVDTLDRLDEVNCHLLRSLRSDDWHRPTMCSAWDVKDIAPGRLGGRGGVEELVVGMVAVIA